MFKALKMWVSYIGAFLTGKLSEKADPRVRINQAIAEQRKKYAQLETAATQVIAHRNMTDNRLQRAKQDVVTLEGEALAAVRLADQASDPAEADRFTEIAESKAQELARRENDVVQLEADLEAANVQAEEAHDLVRMSRQNVKELENQRQQLLQQHASVQMREKANAAMSELQGLSNGSNVSLEQIRASLEERGAKATAVSEVNQRSDAARTQEVREAVQRESGSARLRQLKEANGLGGVSMAKEDRLR